MTSAECDVWQVVTTEDELREVVADPHPAIVGKNRDHVDEPAARFIARSPLFFFGTTAADGTLDVSPRGDPPGSVLVLDGGRFLAFADRAGNRRLDSMRNLLQHPNVGMLFLVPGSEETLRVNGRARIVRDPPFAEQLSLGGRAPELAIAVEVDELFLHCANAFHRSSVWEPERWPAPHLP